jgi:tetratricopeptide (TPR) repeat protein
MLKYMRLIFLRPVFFYALCLGLLLMVGDYKKMMNHALTETMSRLTPPMDYFKEFAARKPTYNYRRLLDCIYYHEKVARYFPYQKAEANAMSAYCYERQGNHRKALELYHASIDNNPNYFWPYYNMGVIYYRAKNYGNAYKYFQQALSQDPVKTIVLLQRSKVYSDVKLSDEIGKYDIMEAYKQGRQATFILLMDSLFKSGEYAQLSQAALAAMNEGFRDDVSYFYAGAGAFHQKAIEESARFLQMAIAKNPRSPEAYMYLGLCLRAAGQEQDAARFLKTSDELKGRFGSLLERRLDASDIRFF